MTFSGGEISVRFLNNNHIKIGLRGIYARKLGKKI